MKQTIKTIIRGPTYILLFGGLFVAVFALHQPSPIDPIPKPPAIRLEATQKIMQRAPVEQPTTTATTATTARANTGSQAPKHDEIKASIDHEYTYRMFATPNDPSYAGNWALAKVQAPAAWDIATGATQTTIAVIDSGFALAHEDLSDRWYTNTGEIGTTQLGSRCWTGTPQAKQSNNCDDDNNSYSDDWRGWNFVLGDGNPQTGRQNPTGDGTRHGTQVAGLAGAGGNNGTGIATINWNTRIMPLQALDDSGIGYTSSITAAIYYAVQNGAHVINLSLGAYANDPAMRAAVNYATAHNVVIVAASGNCGDGTGDECQNMPIGTIAYPAAYPDVIAVGASTTNDQRASFGSYGAALDVSAPGYGVPSSTSWSDANPTSLYSGALYGTSYAAPQVASLVSLIRSIRPSSSLTDISALINATTSKPSSMNGQPYTHQLGHGVINAAAALSIATTLNGTSSVPTLLQTGSHVSEHTAPTGSVLSSGCVSAVSSACTIQLTSSSGHKRYLPYTIINTSGNAGWTWPSDVIIDAGDWEVRARSGDNVSTTPYLLFKK